MRVRRLLSGSLLHILCRGYVLCRWKSTIKSPLLSALINQQGKTHVSLTALSILDFSPNIVGVVGLSTTLPYLSPNI